MLQTISWTGQGARLLDQTRLPMETVYIEVTDERQMWEAIRRLVIRGAPAIRAVPRAFGVYLGAVEFDVYVDAIFGSNRGGLLTI